MIIVIYNVRNKRQCSLFKMAVFVDVVLCSPVEINRRFSGSYCIPVSGHHFVLEG
jgi:hypothetical protein